MCYFDWANILPPAAIAAIVSAIISAVTAFLIAYRNRKTQERLAIEDMLNKMIAFGIEYPYLESQEFCSHWSRNPAMDTESMRYDNFCCFVFNFLSRSYDFYNGKTKEILNFIYVPELVQLHLAWWSEPLNREGYSEEFKAFINSFIAADKQPEKSLDKNASSNQGE